jgi:nitrate reductase alpha subunit
MRSGQADNDWIEAVQPQRRRRRPRIVSHRMPEGTVYMYHAQDRTVDVPLTETDGQGAAASTTR